MTARSPTKAATMYQKAWAMAMLVGVNMPPMLILMPLIFMVATGAWSQTALFLCREQVSCEDVLSCPQALVDVDIERL